MNSMATQKTAILFGATGLVGNHCLDLLLESPYYSKVKVFSRRSIGINHPKLEEYIIDFDKIEDSRSDISGHDVFCTLGTTMKKAGSKAEFIKVDYTYVLKTSKLAVENGAQQLLLVTALGADESSMFFYNKVKGQIENAIQQLNFNSVRIFRPSLLLGNRKEKRLAEKLAIHTFGFLNLITDIIAPKYSAIEARQVARAMVNTAQRTERGNFIYESDTIQKL